MSGADLLSLVFGWHVVALPLALVATYRYSDRSDAFQKSLTGTDQLLARLKGRLGEELRTALDQIFSQPERVPTPILTEGGGTYHEKLVNPVGSEAYRQTVQDFVNEQSEYLAAYHAVRLARERWCAWARRLSWTVLSASIWEGVALVGLGFFGRLMGMALPDWLVTASCVPTVLAFASCMTCFVGVLRAHDTVIDRRREYDPE